MTDDDGMPERDEWGPIFFKLVAEHGLTPEEIGRLTYPQCALILSGGKGDADESFWRAKKALADLRTGRIGWDD